MLMSHIYPWEIVILYSKNADEYIEVNALGLR